MHRPRLQMQLPLLVAGRQARGFSGKVESGFRSENATNAKMLERFLFPVSVKSLWSIETPFAPTARLTTWPSAAA
jgi:hypothetical protein